jgi:hypothetical protein
MTAMRLFGLLLIACANTRAFALSGRNSESWSGIVPLVAGFAGACPLSNLRLLTCPIGRQGR